MFVQLQDGTGRELAEEDRRLFGADAPAAVQPFLTLWRRPGATPLVELAEIAAEAKLGHVYLKDESKRLGMGSFKALGGAYAVMVIFKEMLERELGGAVTVAQLITPTAREFARDITFCCATDGNHGKSVAAGARILGCRSVIFVHEGVTPARAAAIGADEVVRVPGNYDRSVEEAERVSREEGWSLVSDTSWPGYERIPALVGQGYTILADEALRQIQEQGLPSPTHVFLQAGVGGFAASVSAHLSERLGRHALRTIVVEPDRAACLLETARAGALRSFTPARPTIMAMLECYTPSVIGWRVLEKTADAFMTVSDEDARQAMRRLARRVPMPIVAGESGAAGLAGLLALAADTGARRALGLDETARVLLINTEGASDPASFEAIVGAPADSFLIF
ncbi:diaminopropionate ammonia-lyase [Aureimonas frigidaquae]|uniref:Diaminopropionate ammonia-lyase n=1 Tax=Aureimonas frigidaquae TaxID=424757 RepID=A0A0P0Z0R9_9HYPH|nr:diaminopropionate ammonia-lyase [Aureimonas frigidaquae]BAT27437.1 diaminopropionate ammonia-lyase [Aureimonas frigidaquae]